MHVKVFEIRDEGTFVPSIAVRLGGDTEAERYLLARAGFGKDMELQRSYFYLIPLTRELAYHDPVKWNDRTFYVAHQYIQANWHKLTSGQVIDVSYILGEREQPRKSERFYEPGKENDND